MATLPIPLFTSVYKNVREEELRDDVAESYDCIVTEKGGIVKRPGLESFKTGSGGVSSATGLYWWNNLTRLVWVHNNYVGIYKEQPAGTFDLVAAADTIDLTNTRPTFATDGNRIFVANGGNLHAFNSAGGKTNVHSSDSDSPEATSHVAYLDGYILCNKVGDRTFHWSVLDDYDDWPSLSFASAIGNPDYINALHVKDREIYLFGANSTEIWENDGVSPFSRIPGGYIEAGTEAPYSIITTENGIFWLETSRRIVQFAGRGVEYVSTPYDKEIQGLTSVVDAFGFRMRVMGQDIFQFVFPSAGKSYAWNRSTDTWSDWGTWNSASSLYQLPLWGSYVFAPTWGRHFAGRSGASELFQISDTYKDDAGTPIRVYRRTGHLDYGTSLNKRSSGIRLRLRRGAASYSTTPRIMLRWRDNNRYWSNEQEISLGDQGETDIVVSIDSRGIFRTRQYEFSATDAVDINFAYAEEDIDVLSA